jgi:hypothetical protein
MICQYFQIPTGQDSQVRVQARSQSDIVRCQSLGIQIQVIHKQSHR